jgi:hypothetical protein
MGSASSWGYGIILADAVVGKYDRNGKKTRRKQNEYE